MITSSHNPKVQAVRKLQAQAKRRREEQAFVIEGVRLAEEALTAGWEAQQVLFSDQLDERGKAVVEGFVERGTPADLVSEAMMRAISETEVPQGVLVVLHLRVIPLPSSPDFVLVLDGLRDPGNLGTILRTASAAGVEAVLLAPGCADAWSPKVLRAGMGAHFRLSMHTMGWMGIKRILKGPSRGLKVYLADSGGGLAYTQADFRSPLALIVGGEAAGAGPASSSLADGKVHIPMPGGSESLNAGVAASILLFEVLRQRGV
ncbi:MAG: RNA methyltransferase [Anaerolineales bacterium]